MTEAPNAYWFVSEHGTQRGPYTAAIISQRIAEGEISNKALVWREGWKAWEPISIHFTSAAPTDSTYTKTASSNPTTPPIPPITPSESVPKNPAAVPAIAIIALIAIVAFVVRSIPSTAPHGPGSSASSGMNFPSGPSSADTPNGSNFPSATSQPDTDPLLQSMLFTYSDGRYHGSDKSKRQFDKLESIIMPWLIHPSVHATGTVTTGTANRFAKFIADNAVAQGTPIVLDSPGGSVFEAMEMGNFIRANSLDTEVSASPEAHSKSDIPDGCFSACTLIFLGGTVREVDPGALFGVHQISSAKQLSSDEALMMGQMTVGEITKYASEMGISPDFVYELTRASPSDINLLSAEQLKSLNVVTIELETKWGTQTEPGGSYHLVAISQHRHEVNRFELDCSKSPGVVDFYVNATQSILQDAMQYRNEYALNFGTDDLSVPQAAVVSKQQVGDEYANVELLLTPTMINRLRSEKSVTFEMMLPSHVDFIGFETDLAAGRDVLNNYLDSCHAADNVADLSPLTSPDDPASTNASSIAPAGTQGPAQSSDPGSQQASTGTSQPITPSFDCSKAQQLTEQTVCRVGDLAVLDTQYASKWLAVVADARNKHDTQRYLEIRARARTFLKARNECGASVECITAAYESINQYLDSMLNGQRAQ